MDKQNLSKYKYVWKVYRSSVGAINKEKYPVIYANNSKTYYKVGRSTSLNVIDTSYIKDTPAQNDIDGIVRYFHKRYYWNVPDDVEDVFESARKAVDEENECKRIETIIAEYRTAKIGYERAKKAYDALPDEVKPKNEKHGSQNADPIEFWRNG